jgi:tetratricopeptide (TPR) repeat protein
MSLLRESISNYLQLLCQRLRWVTPRTLRRPSRAFWFLKCCCNILVTRPTNPPPSWRRRWNSILHLRPAAVPLFTFRAKSGLFPAFSALLALLFFSVSAAEPESAAPSHEHGQTNKVAVPLPQKASDDEIELLEGTRSNKVSNLNKASANLKFQTALESARSLRQSKELKRAEGAYIQLLEGRAPDEIKRAALLDLGMVMQEQREFTKAQQLYSEFTRRYEKDPAVPEMLLRQGYLYRQMGVPVLALSKFYAVISVCLNLKLDELEYYQKLVLRAQAEIAETYFVDGKYAEATDFLNRLLRLESGNLERAEVLYKLIRCYNATGKYAEAVANARLFLDKYLDHSDAPETRFLLASSLKKLGRNEEALQEIDTLLRSQQENTKIDPKQWLYWQQRAGNEIANQLYQDGDFVNALQVYQLLAALNKAPEWQIPVWYQIGLIFENLKQTAKAVEMYDRIIARELEAFAKGPNASARQVAEMAAWRKQCLNWENVAQAANQQLQKSEEKRDSL